MSWFFIRMLELWQISCKCGCLLKEQLYSALSWRTLIRARCVLLELYTKYLCMENRLAVPPLVIQIAFLTRNHLLIWKKSSNEESKTNINSELD